MDAHSGDADPHLSASRFKRFARCPLSYAIVYRGGYVPPPSKWTIRGSIVHEAMRLAGERGGPYGHAEMLRDAVAAAAAKERGAARFLEEAAELAAGVLMCVPPVFYRIAAAARREERVVAEFDAPGGSFALLAYVDAVVPGAGGDDIYDWKTDSNPNPSDHALQGAVYTAAWEAARGPVASFRLAYFSSGTTFRLGKHDRKAVERAMSGIVAEIRAERWRPNFSSCRRPYRCDTHALCPYQKGR